MDSVAPASPRPIRDFHLLGLFMAGSLLLVVGSLSIINAPDWSVPVPQTLIVTLVVYVVIRAIGWVIGGFVGS